MTVLDRSSLGNASCQYPTLAMVYGGGNHLGQTAASTELHSEQQDLSAKRPSRFDLQQITGW